MSNFEEYMDTFIRTTHHLIYNPDYEEAYNTMLDYLKETKFYNGRLFIIGMGGSAANAQHMANDFRKIAGIDAYSLSDNIAELTARANDDGLDSIYINSLKVSHFGPLDILFVLSVSGGNEEKKASMALVKAMEYACDRDGTVMAIVGMPDSEAEILADVIIVIPTPSKYVTQIAEALQPVIWHGLVSDTSIIENQAKW